MLSQELAIPISRIRSTGSFPSPVFIELSDTTTRLSSELSFRMARQKMIVGFHSVRSLSGFPVDLLAAAPSKNRKNDRKRNRTTNGAKTGPSVSTRFRHGVASDLGAECGTRHECAPLDQTF
jgi:hypothetical protein